jgi:hypothetical protein
MLGEIHHAADDQKEQERRRPTESQRVKGHHGRTIRRIGFGLQRGFAFSEWLPYGCLRRYFRPHQA